MKLPCRDAGDQLSKISFPTKTKLGALQTLIRSDMPELPEVETLCRQLSRTGIGSRLCSLAVYDSKLDGLPHIAESSLIGVRRSGKTIVLDLDNGSSISIHLRMSGRLFLQAGKARKPHTRLRLHFDGMEIDLIDPRRFATVSIAQTILIASSNDFLEGFDSRKFLKTHAGRRVPVKVLLMDAKAFSGIGNIYACEILHRAGISPERLASSLSRDEWKRVFARARAILKKAVQKRGTSISDWRDLFGMPGENQKDLSAYGREGKPCPFCKSAIVRIKQAGRSTFFCPGCQV